MMSENKQTGKSKIPGIVRCIYQRYKNLNKIYNKNSHFKNLNKSNNLEQRNDYYVQQWNWNFLSVYHDVS